MFESRGSAEAVGYYAPAWRFVEVVCSCSGLWCSCQSTCGAGGMFLLVKVFSPTCFHLRFRPSRIQKAVVTVMIQAYPICLRQSTVKPFNEP